MEEHTRKRRVSQFDVLPSSLSVSESLEQQQEVPAISALQAAINAITANALLHPVALVSLQFPGAPPEKHTERIEAALLKNFEFIQRFLQIFFPSIFPLFLFFCRVQFVLTSILASHRI
jgi:hypothetical protein